MTIWIGPEEPQTVRRGKWESHVAHRAASDLHNQHGLLELHDLAGMLGVSMLGFRMDSLGSCCLLAYYWLVPSKAYLALRDAEIHRHFEVLPTESLEQLIQYCRTRREEYQK